MKSSRANVSAMLLFLFCVLTTFQATQGSGWAEVIFTDDFTGTVIDPAKWETRTPCAYLDADCGEYASVTQDESLRLTVTRGNYVFAQAVSVPVFGEDVTSVECETWQDEISSWQDYPFGMNTPLGGFSYYNIWHWQIDWRDSNGNLQTNHSLSMPPFEPWQHFKLKVQVAGDELQWLYDAGDGFGYQLAFSTTDFSLPYYGNQQAPEDIGKLIFSVSDQWTTYVDNVRVESSGCATGLTDYLEIEENFDAELTACEYLVTGNAYQNVGAGEFILAPAVIQNSGSLFSSQKVRQICDVTASFDFYIGGGSGADGLTFAIIPGPELLGPDGGFMGYEGLGGYAVEIDTYFNGWDPDENHIGVMEAGASNHLYSTADIPEIEDAGWFHCDIVFSCGHVEVFLQNDDIAYPLTKVVDFDIPDYIPFDAHVGLVAATGALTNDHIIDNVSITAASAGPSELTCIDLLAPSETTLTDPPTFEWAPDGGVDNVFAVDFHIPGTVKFWSTFNNLGLLIHETNWTMPVQMWEVIPTGTTIYWRVRGADLNHEPLTVLSSEDIRWFQKQ